MGGAETDRGQTTEYPVSSTSPGGRMGGAASDHGQTSADSRAEPAVPEHQRELRARLLPPRRGLQETAPLPIYDELVEEIFLLLPTPTDLIRASAACVSFYRLVARRSFLRRFRKLHAPPLLGFLDHGREFIPAIPPHPSAPAADALALAADFSLSFLTREPYLTPAHYWDIEDVRGGRVLLSRHPFHDLSLAVCDPLHRQYLLLPPIPAFEGWASLYNLRTGWQTFLGDDEEAVEETSFTVVSISQWGNWLGAIMFSSSTGQWRQSPWIGGFAFFNQCRYAYGCFYGLTECRQKLLVLDTWKMEFSLADLPPEARGSSERDVDISFVEAGEGITGMFVHPGNTYSISYLTKRNNGGSSSQWKLEKTIPLDFTGSRFMGSSGMHLLLRCWREFPSPDLGTFTLDIKTFQFERVASQYGAYIYSNFPPSLLSSPTISSGAENEAEEMLEQGGAASSSA
ncbi:hypothetical protein CFC21_086282 [Triticum aestivum]|uniref:F-box protein AT5G49610-like beta-propeller domain-containing protein n=3 Tax=Triticum TaxID=4564 RepID=A0A9R1B6J0_TRITD|nr:uncharacterized protein LOC123133359 [Triticum aestivum]KAF7082410.1 hypothetical protein CFC21_086282 [Triticum aestivum]VAI53344.1 unnamed protein product [Triticum turgidum subsp. durum]